jgi:hypothetical protein
MRAPILVIFTDDHRSDPEGRDLQIAPQGCDMVVEMAIADCVPVPQAGDTEIVIPGTDEGMELSLDMIEHQVVRTLTGQSGPWADAWRRLVPSVTRTRSRRGASAENGTRFAARQLTLTCDMVATPARGGPIIAGSSWDVLLGLMATDAALAPIGAMLRAEIEGEPMSDWRRAAEQLGINLDTADAIGLGPMDDIVGDVDHMPVWTDPDGAVLTDEGGNVLASDMALLTEADLSEGVLDAGSD